MQLIEAAVSPGAMFTLTSAPGGWALSSEEHATAGDDDGVAGYRADGGFCCGMRVFHWVRQRGTPRSLLNFG